MGVPSCVFSPISGGKPVSVLLDCAVCSAYIVGGPMDSSSSLNLELGNNKHLYILRLLSYKVKLHTLSCCLLPFSEPTNVNPYRS